MMTSDWNMTDTVDIRDVLKEFGEPDLRFETWHLEADRKSVEAIAGEYMVFKSDRCNGRCIVYGRYQRGWIPNPSLRYVIFYLLKQKERADNIEHTAILLADRI